MIDLVLHSVIWSVCVEWAQESFHYLCIICSLQSDGPWVYIGSVKNLEEYL